MQVRLGVCTDTTWHAVVLCAYRSKNSPHSSPVTCEWQIKRDGAKWRGCERVILDAHKSQDASSGSACEWQFIRFTLPTVPLKHAQVLSYRISINKTVTCSASIPIPSAKEEWRVVAFSCYDQRRGLGKRLWKNITGEGYPTTGHPMSGAAQGTAVHSWVHAVAARTSAQGIFCLHTCSTAVYV